MVKDCMEHCVYKIASISDMEQKWDALIEQADEDRENWVVWKQSNLDRAQKGWILPYYGFLDGKSICEATAHLTPETVQNGEKLAGNGRVYLSAFRTDPACQGQGYFSGLMAYMLEDLKQRGYTYVTLGVEPAHKDLQNMYAHFGFTDWIQTGKEVYPDQTETEVLYYGRAL